MNVVIIEDEKSAAENLRQLLGAIDPAISVLCIIDTVEGAIDYFREDNNIDLAFLDIHLADGSSFEIFKKVKVSTPIIFTTAYDEYALQAFKLNSIDYLLKPIDTDELRDAIVKFKSSGRYPHIPPHFENVIELIQSVSKKYTSTFLVQQRDKLIPIDVAEIAYFTIDANIVSAITFDDKRYVIDEKLEDIEASLNPDKYFRANRQFIIQRRSIQNLTLYFNGKLILNIAPSPKETIVVSKAKATQIKSWINNQG